MSNLAVECAQLTGSVNVSAFTGRCSERFQFVGLYQTLVITVQSFRSRLHCFEAPASAKECPLVTQQYVDAACNACLCTSECDPHHTSNINSCHGEPLNIYVKQNSMNLRTSGFDKLCPLTSSQEIHTSTFIKNWVRCIIACSKSKQGWTSSIRHVTLHKTTDIL